MAFPFHNPINTDHNDDEWTPPDYAVPTEQSDGEWKPPSYAKAVESKKKEEPESKLSRPITALKDSIPSGVKEFVKGVIALPEDMYTSMNEGGKKAASQIRSGDIHGAFRTVTSPVMAPIDAANDAVLKARTGGGDIQLPSQKDSKTEGISQVLGMAGLPAKDAIDAYKAGNYSKLAGMGLSAVAMAALFHHFGSSGSEKISSDSHPPIREPQSHEIPYRAGSSTQEPVIASQEGMPPFRDVEGDKARFAREDKNLTDPDEFAGESIRQPKVVPRDFGYSDKDSANTLRQIQQPRDLAKPVEDKPIPAEPVKQSGNFNPFGKKPIETPKGDLFDEATKESGPVKAGTPWLGENGKVIGHTTDTEGSTGIKLVDDTKTPETPKREGLIKGQSGVMNISADDPSPKQKPEDEPLSIRQGVPREFALPTDPDVNAQNTPIAKRNPDDILYDIARKKQGMGLDKSSVDEWGHKEGDPVGSTPQSGDFKQIEPSNIENTKNQEAINLAQHELGKLKQTYGDDSEEYQQTARELEDIARSMNAKKVSGDRIDKPQLTGEAWKPPDYAKPINETPKEEPNKPEDDIVDMHGGLGGVKPSSRVLDPNKGPYGAALDKLFNSMGNIKELRLQQDLINRSERGKRFAAFSGVKDEGVKGAAQSLSKLRGEFEKVDFDKLKMTQPQVDSLFTAVKRAKITPGEQARGYTSLFKIFNGELPQRNELAILDDVFGNGFASKITEMHGGLGSIGMNVSKLANTWKSLQNSLSLAAPLRHGIGLMARKEYYPAFTDMFKFFADKEHYQAGMQAISDGPNYLLKREAGLFTAKPGSLMNSEEEFLNSYAGDIPVVRNVVGASQRGYVGFLNKLRDDTSETMLNRAKDLGVKVSTTDYSVNTEDMKTINRLKTFAKNNGISTSVGDSDFIDLARKNDLAIAHETPTKETKAIMRFVNVFSGRGELPFGLDKITNELNTVLWSPRMIASRIQMFTNPKIYMDLPKGMRMEGLKSALAVASLGTVIDTALAYSGAKISYNILSADYGKSRFGTKLVDPWGGFQQYVVSFARFLAGKTDSKTPTSRLKILGNFAASKESPAASLAHTLLTSKFTGKSFDSTAGNMTTQYGEKTSIQSQVGKQFVPIFIQDMNDLVKSEPKFADDIGLNSILTGASLAGMEQTYPAKKTQRLSIRKPQLR